MLMLMISLADCLSFLGVHEGKLLRNSALAEIYGPLTGFAQQLDFANEIRMRMNN